MSFNYSAVFLAISADNLEILVDFYHQLWQKPPAIYRPPSYAEFQLAKLRLAIFKPKADSASEFEYLNSGMSLCIEVENLEQAITTLNKIGYPPPGEIITASHGKEIYAYDPVGNRLILHQST